MIRNKLIVVLTCTIFCGLFGSQKQAPLTDEQSNLTEQMNRPSNYAGIKNALEQLEKVNSSADFVFMSDHKTPLMYAVLNGKIKTINFILDHLKTQLSPENFKIALNKETLFNKTALSIVADAFQIKRDKNNGNILKLLIEYGAVPREEDLKKFPFLQDFLVYAKPAAIEAETKIQEAIIMSKPVKPKKIVRFQETMQESSLQKSTPETTSDTEIEEEVVYV
jgi:hypothetical protein